MHFIAAKENTSTKLKILSTSFTIRTSELQQKNARILRNVGGGSPEEFVSDMSKTEKTKAVMSYAMALCDFQSEIQVFDEVDPNGSRQFVVFKFNANCQE
ncbi:hypothetical protein B9Z55_007838 [Caenorhabditis nigoni]|uniref:Uncharacterized protein n=1 Tax=Caenorhabditis nigoni TaxID=1611254 RepID=A0A2G5VBS9_9PELO|nr:hypothetical protein B9Z55_007838 [Caenorhabditis nigoni]